MYNNMKELKLSQYAKLKNRCYRTLWNHFKDGKIPNAYQNEKGTIYIRMTEDEINVIVTQLNKIIKPLGKVII